DILTYMHSALGGIFVNLGQNCIASERMIVLEGIYDQFIREIPAHASRLRQGVPQRGGNVDVGAITTPQQIRVIDTLVKDALEKGAQAVVGGAQVTIGNGTFYPPTILTGITNDMRIAREEIFGPVMLVFKVKTESDAIALANSTEFGLHSSVITTDRERGRRIAAQLE